jgi:hypothetical protein
VIYALTGTAPEVSRRFASLDNPNDTMIPENYENLPCAIKLENPVGKNQKVT